MDTWTDLEAIRSELKLTQPQAAERLGVPEDTYKSWRTTAAIPDYALISARAQLELSRSTPKRMTRREFEESIAPGRHFVYAKYNGQWERTIVEKIGEMRLYYSLDSPLEPVHSALIKHVVVPMPPGELT